MRRLTGLWLLVLLATPALADETKAREEVEQELKRLVGKAPTRVKIEYAGVDEPNYVLEEAEFEIDGATVKSPPPSAIEKPNAVVVWQGDVPPGKHTLTARVVYANKTSSVVSDEGGYKWKLAGTVSFELFAGIEVQVKVTATRVPDQKDVSKRFKLSLPAAPVMLAALDDGKMPEPIKRVEPDAGVVVAAVDPKQQAKAEAEAKRLAAAEEKKAKAEAAKAAKEEAALAAQQAAAARAEARREAAAEKKRKAEEAKLAKAEAVRQAREEAERKRHPERYAASEPAPALDAGAVLAAVEAPDAGVEELDAGAAVAVAAAPPPDAGTPMPEATAAAEEGGVPWLSVGLGGGALVVLVLVVLARRRSSVPKID